MASALYEKLKNQNALPSPAGVALRLLRLASEEDSTVEAIAVTIESDPALAARVLKLVNSPIAGTSRRIGSISSAVVLLGLRTLKNLALGISLISNNRAGRCEDFDFDGFWRESIARAVAARHLAARLGGLQSDEAFTVGLLGKVGQLALAIGYPDQYAQVLARVRADDSADLAEVERQVFGADHKELSAEMMGSWYVPEALCDIVRGQSAANWANAASSTQSSRTVATLFLASLIAKTLNPRQTTPDLQADLDRQAQGVGITSEELAGLLDAIKAECLQTADILSLNPDDTPTLKPTQVEPSGGQGEDCNALKSDRTAAWVRAAESDPLRILVVDDDANSVHLLHGILTSCDYQVLTASNTAEAMAVDHAHAPQMIITNWRMPGIDGLELCRRVRAQEGGGLVYIFMLTADSMRAKAVEALNAGADEFLTRPYNHEELLARVRAGERVVRLKADLAARALEVSECNVKLAAYNEKLQAVASKDELTGLFSRREAMLSLAEHWALSVRQASPLSCVMIDIDRFKQFNDTHGHKMGDLVLAETANRLRASVRGGERLCRFGGEEFLIICPGSSAAAAQRLAERLRNAVGSRPIKIKGIECGVTISLGVAERAESMTISDDLLAAADAALYAAKRAGRNRVCVAGDQSPAGHTSDSGSASTRLNTDEPHAMPINIQTTASDSDCGTGRET